jgi:phage-related baseplate assembly protein
MSTLTFAEKDAATVLAQALQIYFEETGVHLAEADPRRLHLQAFLLLLAQQRQLIDYSGKQNLLRYVDLNMPIEKALFLQALAELWGEKPLPAEPSTCTIRFSFAVSGPQTIPHGTKVTDGTNTWAVGSGDVSSIGNVTFLDAPVFCTVPGSTSNGVTPGQIDTLVDPIFGCTGVVNTTETISGRDIETTEAFRERLRLVPESRSTCGPRIAYEAAALEASASVADVVALGARDAADMLSNPPPPAGDVWIFLTEGTRDANGVLISTIPTPSAGLLTTVGAALSAEDVRPLTDHVVEKTPIFRDFDVDATYYIAKSRSKSAIEIQAAVALAFDAYVLWQQAIGRDINPSELTTRLVNAGAKRVVLPLPFVFEALMSDQCSRIGYATLTYGGVEND